MKFSFPLSAPAASGVLGTYLTMPIDNNDDTTSIASADISPSSSQSICSDDFFSPTSSNTPRCIEGFMSPGEKNPFVKLRRMSFISALSSPLVTARSWCDICDDEDDDNFSVVPRLSDRNSISTKYPGSPSIGSANHGKCCTPCVFIHKAAGCKEGADCEFCHLCDKQSFLQRKKERMILGKEIKRATRIIRESNARPMFLSLVSALN